MKDNRSSEVMLQPPRSSRLEVTKEAFGTMLAQAPHWLLDRRVPRVQEAPAGATTRQRPGAHSAPAPAPCTRVGCPPVPQLGPGRGPRSPARPPGAQLPAAAVRRP